MRRSRTAAKASSSRSKTRAGPRWNVRSFPAIFSAQPSGTRQTRLRGTLTYSAWFACPAPAAATRSPGTKSSTPAPTATTSPATEYPTGQPCAWRSLTEGASGVTPFGGAAAAVCHARDAVARRRSAICDRRRTALRGLRRLARKYCFSTRACSSPRSTAVVSGAATLAGLSGATSVPTLTSE